MILQSLVALANREGLVDDPHFEKKRIDYVIRIQPDGRFVNLESRLQEDGKGQEIYVPRMPKRSRSVAPSFLFDNAKYVIGVGTQGKDKPERLEQCEIAFRDLIASASSDASDPSLMAVANFYKSIDANKAVIFGVRGAEEWTGSEWLTFALVGTESLAHESEGARAWWTASREANTRLGKKGKRKRLVRCLVTGVVGPPARLHGAVKRVPDGQSSGASLVSFNAGAFESHGHKQGSNAPVSQAAADAYVAALNWLLEKPEADKRPHRFGVQLSVGGSTKVRGPVALYWTRRGQPSMNPFVNFFSNPTPDDVDRLLRSPHAGVDAARSQDDDAFYVLVIGGNAARIVVRDWIEKPLTEVKANLGQYFEDLSIVGEEDPLPIWRLLKAIDPPGRASSPPDLGARLFMAAIRGTPLPRELMRHALLRLRVSPDKENAPNNQLKVRCALIKAVLCGMARANPTNKHLEVSLALDENKTEVPYLLGRLFACLERAQANALGDIGATIRDRYFASASSNPVVVFPRLIRLAQHHVAKAKSEQRDFGIERRIGVVVNLLPPEKFPATLTLPEQGLFAVGYYHQLEDFFKK